MNGTLSAADRVLGDLDRATYDEHFGASLRVGDPASGILIIEDNQIDLVLVEGLVRRSFGDVPLLQSVSLATALAVLETENPVAALCDLTLPDAEDLDAVLALLSSRPGLPIVVLSGRNDAGLAEAAVAAGAQDFLSKDTITEDLLGRSLRYAIRRGENEWSLRQLAERLTAANRDLERLAATAAHDLRAPLRTARLFSDLIARQTEGVDVAHLRRLNASLEHMEALVDGVMDWASIRSGLPSLRRVELDAVVAEVLGDLGDRYLELGGAAVVESLPAVVGDPVMLRSAFQNLLDNAIKYRRPGVPPVARIEARPAGRHTDIFVIDNGQGIPPAYRARVLDAFERLHAQHDVPGIGIGLAVCAEVAATHGGTLSILDGADGVGTTMVLRLEMAG